MLKEKVIQILIFDPDVIKQGMHIEFTMFKSQPKLAKVLEVFDELIKVIDTNNNNYYFDTEEAIEYRIRVVKG